jgi:hypothetical protein
MKATGSSEMFLAILPTFRRNISSESSGLSQAKYVLEAGSRFYSLVYLSTLKMEAVATGYERGVVQSRRLSQLFMM